MAADMTVLYRIKDWVGRYENNRTRELKAMQWVPIPTQLDGDGYTELVDHKDGPAHYGVWVGCVIVASRCDPRGTLLRGTKKPFCASSLGRVLRMPATLIDNALKRFVSIGWMEVENIDGETTCGNPAGKSQEGAGISQDNALNGMEGMEGKKKGFADLPPHLRAEEFQKTLADWLEYKRERGEPYKPTGLKKMISRAANLATAHGLLAVVTAMERAMASNWAGWDHASLLQPAPGAAEGEFKQDTLSPAEVAYYAQHGTLDGFTEAAQ